VPAVEAGAKAFGMEKLENLREDRPAQNFFDKIIAEILQKQKKVAFLVSTRHAGDTSLRFLVHHRLLHVWDESYSSPSFSGERFMVLSIDYCIVVEHLKAPKYRTALALPFTEEAAAEIADAKEDVALLARFLDSEKLDKREVRYVVLPDSLFSTAERVRCTNCKNEYSEDHPVVRQFRVCPHCAQTLAGGAAGGKAG
jgi:ribosomal protein S27E